MIFNVRFLRNVLFGLMICGVAPIATAVDWQSVEAQTVNLFFPGNATWENVLTKSLHSGATGLRNKEGCQSCHQGEEQGMGEAVANDSGHAFHRQHSGARALTAELKIAVDETNIYFRFVLPPLAKGKLTLLLDNGDYDLFADTGCWSSCHQDNRGMADAAALDLTKYLSRSRSKNTRSGGGENYKSAAELNEMLNSGEFLELLAVAFGPASNELSASQGYILERRHQRQAKDMSVHIVRQDKVLELLLSRPLLGSSVSEKTFSLGGHYTLAVALHENDAEGASHLVSLPISFTIGQDRKVIWLPVAEK